MSRAKNPDIKGAITYTKGDEWWLERITFDLEQVYPRIIKVGELEKPRVYAPVSKCRIISDSPNYGHCSECGAQYDYHDSDRIADESSGDPYCYDGAFCKRCGAWVIE